LYILIARDGVVDEPELIHALQQSMIRAAGQDVFATEALPADSPLIGLLNAVPRPYIGSATHKTRYCMSELAGSDQVAVL